jgi:hypothetical protein
MFIKLVSYALITCTIISPFFAGCAGRRLRALPVGRPIKRKGNIEGELTW